MFDVIIFAKTNLQNHQALAEGIGLDEIHFDRLAIAADEGKALRFKKQKEEEKSAESEQMQAPPEETTEKQEEGTPV